MRCGDRRRVLALCVALLALSAALGPARAVAATAHASVVNGAQATPGSYPYLAFIEYEGSSEIRRCTGTVVSGNVVLTAAHCVLDSGFSSISPPGRFAVVTGAVDRTSSARTVSSVSRIAVAPDFSYLSSSLAPVRADAALLELSQPVSAPAVRLATSQTWSPGTAAVIVGWGLTESSAPAGAQPPTTLHYGQAVVEEGEPCVAGFPAYESDWQICTLDDPAREVTTCYGDSGGPLLTAAPDTGEPLEIGITSFGDVGCPTDVPAYFSRVDTVAGWMRETVAAWAPAPEPTPRASVGRLPRLSGARAGALVRRALRKQLRGRFRGHRAFRARCARVTRSRRRCSVSWWVGGRDYRGTVTVFYFFAGGGVSWKDRFTIRQASRRCVLRSAHPGACPGRTFRR